MGWEGSWGLHLTKGWVAAIRQGVDLYEQGGKYVGRVLCACACEGKARNGDGCKGGGEGLGRVVPDLV